MVVHDCKPCTWEVKGGGSGVQVQPQTLRVQSYIGLPKILFQNKTIILTVIYRQELGLTAEIRKA